MHPRDPHCDNDDCQRDGEGGWIHTKECEAERPPPLTDDDRRRIIANAPEGSFLATTFGPALGLGEHE